VSAVLRLRVFDLVHERSLAPAPTEPLVRQARTL
jgi:hypothetical protein